MSDISSGRSRRETDNWLFFNILNNSKYILIGYAQVSTTDQTMNLQTDALENIGHVKIFTDTKSGSATERKRLDETFSYVREDGTLVVWLLDCLDISLKHLIGTITLLYKQREGSNFPSLFVKQPSCTIRTMDHS